jgi:hypothetical protein
MIRAGRLWDDRVYGIAQYHYGERTEMGGHVDGRIECRTAKSEHLILKSALRSLGLRYKIPGIDFKAGAGMFSVVASIESIPRRKLTSNESSWGNHEPCHVGLLARGTRKKKILHQRRLNSSPFVSVVLCMGLNLHRVCTGSLICGRPSGASSRLWLVDVNCN